LGSARSLGVLDQSEPREAIFSDPTGSGVDQESESLSEPLRDLGGPGSGRYPKGSGKSSGRVPLSGLPVTVTVTSETEKLYQKITGNPGASLERDLHNSFVSRPDSNVTITAAIRGRLSKRAEDRITIRLRGEDNDGEMTHEAALSIRPEGTIYIGGMEVSERMRTSNVAIETLRGVHQLTQRSGVDDIEMNAGSSHGGYAWAKIGATALEPEELAQEIGSYVDFDSSRLYDDDDRYNLLDLLKTEQHNPKLPWLLASYRSTSGKLLGPHILRGTQWDGRFDMKDPEAVARFKRLVYRERE
jgi:hypothetical protein